MIESLKAVAPIMVIVLLLCLTIVPASPSTVMGFLFGSVLLIIGMMFFSLGAELAMAPMGELTGSHITQSKRVWLVLLLGFLLGFIITISEPDLQVLADQVAAVPNRVLILTVAVGVGLFLAVALMRMLFSVALPTLLIVFYSVVFLLTIFVPESFLAVAFDAGGVTTGPMTVPFIMAFGIGISAIRSDRHASNDSFGLVAICSIGPILAVLILGLIYHPDNTEYIAPVIPEITNSIALGELFLSAFPEYISEIGLALSPVILFFMLFHFVCLRLESRTLARIGVGLFYTYAGLVLFLTGANVGFVPMGIFLGNALTGFEYRWIVVPVGMVMGYCIVMAEPAVYVLMEKVEELTDGAIRGITLKRSLCFSVSVSVGIALLRVLKGISILWLLIPGYAIAILLSLLTPKIFTAIAFDSGGVASGPMTSTFLLPLAVRVCLAIGGNPSSDAFGVVAMVAMTPLLAVQFLGIAYRMKVKRHEMAGVLPIRQFQDYGDFDIIEL